MAELIGRGLTVRELLHIPQFHNARLLGGRAGLDAYVSRVNVMEVPDVTNWVRPGEMLVTTGYPFRDDPEALTRLIAELAEKRVAAFGIKPKRFIADIPRSAIEAADEHGLPLVELPENTAFSDVVRNVMEHVLIHESKDLSELQMRVQRMTQVLMAGRGLEAFLIELEKLLDNPVALLEGESVRYVSPEAEAWSEELALGGWRSSTPQGVDEPVVFYLAGQSSRVLRLTVIGGSKPAELVMFDTHNAYSALDALTLNWAAKLIGFEMNNARARSKIEEKYIDQFLQDWISGRIVSASDLKLRAEACGCPLDDKAAYVVGLVRCAERGVPVPELTELARQLQWESDASRMRWTVVDGRLNVLITLGASTERIQLEEASRMLRRHRRDAVLCAGRPAVHTQVRQSSQEAVWAWQVSSNCGLDDAVVGYNDLGVNLLLHRLLGTPEAEQFLRMYWQPIYLYDLRHQGMIVNTLKMFFAAGCNVKEAAERLFVHYNTVTYRLERIRQELGFDLGDTETRLRLQLAIRFGEMSEYYEEQASQ